MERVFAVAFRRKMRTAITAQSFVWLLLLKACESLLNKLSACTMRSAPVLDFV